VQLVEGVTDAQWAQWNRERQRRADWTRDIIDWSVSRKGTARIVREGMFSAPDEQGHRQSISVYYFLIPQYDALGPPPSKAVAPTTEFPLPPEQAVKYAKATRSSTRRISGGQASVKTSSATASRAVRFPTQSGNSVRSLKLKFSWAREVRFPTQSGSSVSRLPPRSSRVKAVKFAIQSGTAHGSIWDSTSEVPSSETDDRN
jgi:hypothetical protein